MQNYLLFTGKVGDEFLKLEFSDSLFKTLPQLQVWIHLRRSSQTSPPILTHNPPFLFALRHSQNREPDF
jgi:hypothetical protein